MLNLGSIAFDAREPDLVHVRRVTRRLTQLLGFESRDEVKITAAVSELTRAAGAASGGTVEVAFRLRDAAMPQHLVLEVAGPGLADAARKSGGLAADSVVAAEKLLERFAESSDEAKLCFAKTLPARASAVTVERAAAIAAELKRMDPTRTDLSRDELQLQSRQLTEALLNIEERKTELATLNAELGDTNRGVLALYAELDERASHLRRADELKTRFFSQMSHEFRTPLSSILALSNMLLEEADGPLTEEQRRQVGLVRAGVADLLDLVGDLLDLAKMEAGKTRVNVGEFSVSALFAALRAMVRPLLRRSAVAVEFDDAAAELPPLVSDESKVTQILRNFLSNAVKFTDRGAISVAARLVSADTRIADVVVESDSMLFAVADTGIGISPEHHGAIFDEFRQIDNPLQGKARGSGLGLPLCRRLAALLDGRVWVESEPGQGSTFYLLIPLVHRSAPTHGDHGGRHATAPADRR